MKNRPDGVTMRWVLALAVVSAMLPWAAVAGEKGSLDEKLIEAARRGDLGLVKSLLEKGANVNANTGETALFLSAGGGHVEIVKFLLEKGADVNAETGFGTTALLYAAGKGYFQVVKMLLHKGADVHLRDNDGGTALECGAGGGNVEVVKLLLDMGADAKDNAPLVSAAALGHIEVIRLLLAKGADVNAKDHEGWTALKQAQKRGSTEIVELLKAHGAKQ